MGKIDIGAGGVKIVDRKPSVPTVVLAGNDEEGSGNGGAGGSGKGWTGGHQYRKSESVVLESA